MEEYMNYSITTIGEAGLREPRLISRQTVASADGYMIRLLQLGVMEGALGEMEISPVLRPLLEAMHHVLTGGEIKIDLVAPGNSLLVQELNRRLEEATHELNAINQRSGYTVLPRT